ncbi:hypothetical protein ACROYT_G012653 [Oculina patagonica]
MWTKTSVTLVSEVGSDPQRPGILQKQPDWKKTTFRSLPSLKKLPMAGGSDHEGRLYRVATMIAIIGIQVESAATSQARAEAVAAQKKAEMERKMAEIQAQSALLLEQEEKKKREEEMAFARKKREEEAQIACLHLEQEAAVALAKANAMDE